MIWPFSHRAAPAEIKDFSEEVKEQVAQGLADFKTAVLALEFVHAREQDAATRGRFLAAMERVTALVPAVGWGTEETASLAEKVASDCLISISWLQEHELDMSFTEAMTRTGTWHSNPFENLSRVHALMRQHARSESAAAITALTALAFPPFSYPDLELQQLVAELKTAWEKRAGQQLSVEDRYFIEALAATYLPESIQLLTSLRAEPKLAPEAEAMFRKQVSLLHRRLSAIEDPTGKRQLQAMAIHTAFLEERLRAEPAQRLELQQ